MHGFRRGFLATIALLLILVSAFDAPGLLAQQGQSDTIRVITRDCLRAASDFTHPGSQDNLTVSYDGLLWTAPTVGESITNGRAGITGSRNFTEARLTVEYVNTGIGPVDMKVVAKDTTLPRLE